MLIDIDIDYSFTIESMQKILTLLKSELAKENQNEVVLEVLNPDVCEKCYSGKVLDLNGQKFLYRGYKAWVDLAEILYCKIATPRIHKPHTILLKLKKLDPKSSFHTKNTLLENLNKDEKYGTDSQFAQICKNEEPAFLEYYLRALKNVNVCTRKKNPQPWDK